MSTTSDGKPVGRKRNFKRGCLLFLGAVCVVALSAGGFAYFQLRDLLESQQRLQSNLDSAAKVGVEPDFSHLPAPLALPPDQNAAIDLARAAMLAGEAATVLPQGRLEGFVDGADTDADQVLAAFKPSLDQFSIAATKVGCQFPRDWSRPDGFDFKPISGLKLSLAILGRRAQTHFAQGRVEQGAADLELLKGTIDMATAEPLLPVSLIRAEYTAIWVSACMQCLSAMPSVAPRIKGYLQSPVTFDVVGTVRNQASLAVLAASEVGESPELAKLLDGLPTDQKVVQDALLSEVAVAARQAVEIASDSGNDLTNLIFRSLTYEADWAAKKTKSSVLARRTLPQVVQLAMTLGRLEDRRLLALEACDVVVAGTPAGYKPKSLDTFGQKPFVYKKSDNGFVLYALGKDGIDNGGHGVTSGGGTDHVLTFSRSGTTILGG